jgi:hypothetical protein
MVIASIIAPVVPSRSIVKLIASNRFVASPREHSRVYSCTFPAHKFRS